MSEGISGSKFPGVSILYKGSRAVSEGLKFLDLQGSSFSHDGEYPPCPAGMGSKMKEIHWDYSGSLIGRLKDSCIHSPELSF